jgi:hypothetical protein
VVESHIVGENSAPYRSQIHGPQLNPKAESGSGIASQEATFAYTQIGCSVFKLQMAPRAAEPFETCQHRLRIYPAGSALRAQSARRDHSYSGD